MLLPYTIKTGGFYINKKTDTIWDTNGQNPITTTTDYFYDNPTHIQLTRSEVTDSQGKVIETKTLYPDDVEFVNSLENDPLTPTEKAAIDLLKAPSVTNPNRLHRIAEPVQIETTVKNGSTLVSKNVQRINYKD